MNLRRPICPPFQTQNVSGRKTPFGAGLCARWKDADGAIYEWDYKKGAVERYDRTGQRHLGDFDPITGSQVGRPSKRRKVEP